MKPMLSIFTPAIKFDCLFLAIFKNFYWFVSFIFDKIAFHLNICFKRCFKSLFSPFQCNKKNSLRSAENVIFSFFCILVDRPIGGYYAPCPPPGGYATNHCIASQKYSFYSTEISVKSTINTLIVVFFL